MSAKKSVSLDSLFYEDAKLFLFSPCSKKFFAKNVLQKVRDVSVNNFRSSDKNF